MNRTAESSLGSQTSAAGTCAFLRSILMLAFVCIAILLSYQPLRSLMSAPGRSDYYSHILLIPFVSAYFFFIERKRILADTGYSWKAGIPLIGAGLLAYGVALWQKEWLGANDFASLTTAASIVVVWGGFVLIYGSRSFRAGRFPLLFLLFAIPVPRFLLDRFIYILQVGSTEVTQWLFDLTGTTYFRDGFTYQLANITIEVAKECSGIRSTLALIISCVVAGRLFLKSGWRQLILLVAILPITIFKNAVRILTLSLLAVYVDTRFITGGWLHHSGGIVFYIPSLWPTRRNPLVAEQGRKPKAEEWNDGMMEEWKRGTERVEPAFQSSVSFLLLSTQSSSIPLFHSSLRMSWRQTEETSTGDLESSAYGRMPSRFMLPRRGFLPNFRII